MPVPSPYTCSLTGAVAVVGKDVEGHLEKPSRSPAGALLKHTHAKALTARAAGRELRFTHNLGFNPKYIYNMHSEHRLTPSKVHGVLPIQMKNCLLRGER